MGDNDEDIVKEIKLLENRLKALRVSLKRKKERREETSEVSGFRVGDRVRVRNPKDGQEAEGFILKINLDSGYHTVVTRTQSIKRIAKNLERIDSVKREKYVERKRA